MNGPEDLDYEQIRRTAAQLADAFGGLFGQVLTNLASMTDEELAALEDDDDDLTPRMAETTDAVQAVADLCGRSGASDLEIGYLHEDPLNPDWYATVTYRGAKLIAEKQPAPGYAADLLAHRILDGGECTHCHRITTTRSTALGLYVSGRIRDTENACVWHRDGNHWYRGCETTPEVVAHADRS